MSSETKENETSKSKKGMGAFRLSHEILDNLKTVSKETGIPASTIVTKCLEKKRVVEIVRGELEKSLSKFKSLDDK